MTALLTFLTAKDISAAELSQRSKLDQQRCDALLNGADPTVTEALRISDLYDVPLRHLIVEPSTKSLEGTKFRFNFDRTASRIAELEAAYVYDRLAIIAESGHVGEEMPFLKNFPKTAGAAEHLSNIYRRNFLGLGESDSLQTLDVVSYEKLGLITTTGKYRLVEGTAFRNNFAAYVVLAERNDMRMLFTLAHEIAHLLVDLDDDKIRFWADEDVWRRRPQSILEERFANAFASALLIPAAGVVAVLRSYRQLFPDAPSDGITANEVYTIAFTYGTSFHVAARRLETLELLPIGSAALLNGTIQEKFGTPEIFGRDIGFPEREKHDWSVVSERVAGQLWQKLETAQFSVSELAYSLGLSSSKFLRAGNV